MTAALAAIGASSLAPVQQEYLLEARQMQSLSFIAHIPLVCFAISFPAMVLFSEWMFLRTGDDGWANAIGVAALMGFVVLGFVAVVVPDLAAEGP